MQLSEWVRQVLPNIQNKELLYNIKTYLGHENINLCIKLLFCFMVYVCIVSLFKVFIAMSLERVKIWKSMRHYLENYKKKKKFFHKTVCSYLEIAYLCSWELSSYLGAKCSVNHSFHQIYIANHNYSVSFSSVSLSNRWQKWRWKQKRG